MLCHETKDLGILESDKFIAERKLDGSRAILIKKGDEIRVIGRRGLNYKAKLPEFQEDFSKLGDVVLDGELVFLFNGREKLNIVQKRLLTESRVMINFLAKRYPLSYYVFDILELDGEDLRDLELLERKRILDEFFREKFNCIKKLDYTFDKKKLWKEVIKKDLEGIILKDIHSRYLAKRSKSWLKLKNWKEAVLEFTSYEVNPAGVLLLNDNGDRVQCSGRQSEKVRKLIDERGKVKVVVQYLEKTKDGRLRMPTFKEIYGNF